MFFFSGKTNAHFKLYDSSPETESGKGLAWESE